MLRRRLISVLGCIDAVRGALPSVQIEVRMDSAFFSDEIVMALAQRGVEFTVSVPFERFVELKGMIEQRRRWQHLDVDTWYFETSWKPQCWDRRFRFLFIRTRIKKQRKGPVQLDPTFRRSHLRFDAFFEGNWVWSYGGNPCCVMAHDFINCA